MTHSITTVYVPTVRLSDPDVRDAIATLRWIARGMTSTEHVGSWFGGTVPNLQELKLEPITTLAFITEHRGASVDTFHSVLDRLVSVLKSLGEQSVLITSSNTVATFR